MQVLRLWLRQNGGIMHKREWSSGSSGLFEVTKNRVNICLLAVCTALLLGSCGVNLPDVNEPSSFEEGSAVTPEDSSAVISEAASPDAEEEEQTQPAQSSVTAASVSEDITQTEESKVPEVPLDGNQYTMNLTLDTDADTIGGTETVVVQNTSDDTWNELCFRDYSSLFTIGGDSGYYADGAVSEISGMKDVTKNMNLQIKRDPGDVSVVYMSMPVPMKPGDIRVISFDFLSYIPVLESRYGYMNGVYNLGNFYPVLAVYEDGAWSTEEYFLWGECFYSVVSDFEVVLTVPHNYDVISSGLSSLYTSSDQEDVWRIDADRVRDFALIIGTDYGVVSGIVDGITINCYYRDGDTAWGEEALEAAVTAVKVFSETFGLYPYPELDIAETYIDAGGMEYPNLVMINESFGNYAEMDSRLKIYVVHEAAHQWFYGIVGDNQYTQAWLDESFASYSELVYKETFLDESEIMYEVDMLEDSMESEGIPNAAEEYYVNKSYSEFDSDQAYTYTVYYRGEVFLYRLREAMGTELFNTALKDYVGRYSLKVAQTEDFTAVITEYAGDNADVMALLAKYIRPDDA